MISITELLQPKVQTFISTNENTAVHKLILKYQEVEGIPITIIAQQIEARKKAKHKLPNWYTNGHVIFPSPLAVEQSSSELLASTKLQGLNGLSAIDLTGGLGVDAVAFSQTFDEVTYCEIDADIFSCAQHNFKVLGAKNISCLAGDGLAHLMNSNTMYDLVYVDPSRRAADQSRVFKLDECSPDIVEHWDLLLDRGRQVLIKLSPLIDLQYLIKTLSNIQKIKVLSYKNDVKEVLLYASKEKEGSAVAVECIDINTYSNTSFSINDWEGRAVALNMASPNANEYIYIPNNTILKANLQDAVANRYQLNKWHKQTHLYSSGLLHELYPGRIFRTAAISSFNNKELRKLLPSKKANVILKNTQLSPSELQKRMNWKDGGELYIIGGQTAGDKNVAVLARIFHSK